MIQLAIVALLGNAAYQIGSQYVTHYTFVDAVRQAARFGPKDEAALRAKIMGLASVHDVPLDAGDLLVKRADGTILVQGSYDRAIPVAPRYPYPWHFDWQLTVTPSN